MDPAAIETKLQAARTRLILDKPFLGALVLRLPMVAANPDWCRTTATDARKFYYNPEYIQELRPAEAQFVLAHEALHCALSHFARRGHRIKMRWDAACDYAINPLLVDDDLTPPPGSLVMNEYRGMTAEEIYPCIEENPDQETLDQHVYEADNPDGGGQRESTGEGDSETKGQPQETQSPDEGDSPNDDGDDSGGTAGEGEETEVEQPQGQGEDGEEPAGAPQPEPLSKKEMETLSLQWQQRLVGAAQQAMQAGKMGANMARMVNIMVQPSLPWRMILARYVSSNARDDYSYSRPSSRRGDPAVFPSLRSAQLNLTVVIDTSGSLSDREISEFVSEISAIKGTMRARIQLMTCDAKLAEGCPWTFEPWEEVLIPEKMTGGGGTSFIEPFKHAELQDAAPDALIYFTDAQGRFPQNPPWFPVIWLVKGRAEVPWGQRIQLN